MTEPLVTLPFFIPAQRCLQNIYTPGITLSHPPGSILRWKEIHWQPSPFKQNLNLRLFLLISDLKKQDTYWLGMRSETGTSSGGKPAKDRSQDALLKDIHLASEAEVDRKTFSTLPTILWTLPKSPLLSPLPSSRYRASCSTRSLLTEPSSARVNRHQAWQVDLLQPYVSE